MPFSTAIDDFGKSYPSSEPYFYDQSYAKTNTRRSPIVVECKGRCVVAEEIGKIGRISERPFKWKCTSECKLPTSYERQCILDLKSMFDSIRLLRRRLDAVDSGCQNGHYRDGHPLPCTFTGCTSKLRMLRAACPHYVVLRMFVCHLYKAVKFIDRALRAGNWQ